MILIGPGRLEQWRGPILEIACSPRLQGIPGALLVHPSHLERARYPDYRRPEDACLLPLPRLRQALGQLGLRWNEPVLLYGRERGWQMGAARVAWAMLAAGMESVGWLDGPYRGPLTPFRAWPQPVDFGSPPDRFDEFVTRQPRGLLADVRSRPEWSGERQDRYAFFSSKGHLAGAAWVGDWTTLLKRGRLCRPRWPLDLSQELVFYCGTGWRSSLACLQARALGARRVLNLDGGVFAWTRSGGELTF